MQHGRSARRRRGEANYRIVRYADDFVILVAGERRHAEALIAETEQVIMPLGLTLSREKTSIAHIDEGIEFLGWRIQRQPGRDGRPQIYTYPSKPSLQAVMGKVKQITRTGQNQTLDQLLNRLNPGLRGWCDHFRHGVSWRTFNYLRAYVWRRVIIWLRHRDRPPRTELALAQTPLPTRLVADRRNGQPRQPRRGEDHSLPLPRQQDPHPMGPAALRAAVIRPRTPGSADRPMTHRHAQGEPGAWERARRARWGAGTRKRSGPKDRHRASGLPNHVVRLGQRAVDQVRRDEWNAHDRSHTRAGKWIKGTRWSLLKSPEKQTIDQLAKLSEVQQANKPLYRAFLLKEELRLLYHLNDPSLAPEHLDAWLTWASRSRLEPFVKLARTIRRYRAGILNAIRLGLDNGRLEGLNSRIRLISHRSFGFHSPSPLIALIYLCCAGVHVPLPR